MLPVAIPEEAEAEFPYAHKMNIGAPANAHLVPSLRDCGSLPAIVERPTRSEPGRVRSYWRPSEEELQALNEGRPIELCVVTWPMVPVALNVL